MDSCLSRFEFAAPSSSGDAARQAPPSATTASAEATTEPPTDLQGASEQGALKPPTGPRRYGNALEGQAIRGISTHSTALLGDFTAWLDRYAAGEWDPISNELPFGGQRSPSVRSEASAVSPSPSSRRLAPSGGPEFKRWSDDGWLPPPLPPSEDARRRALYRHAILPDANPASGEFDSAFQRISRMAQRSFGVAACVILLVEKERLPVLASVGFEATIYDRESSICGHTILRDKPHVILDTNADFRFNTTHPYVQGETPIRFYAGTQLRDSDGFALGTLCLIDTKPHASFDDEEIEQLLAFGELAMKEVDLRMTRSHLARINQTSAALRTLTLDVVDADLADVYDRAARSIRETLDVEGCAILDLGAFKLGRSPATAPTGSPSAASSTSAPAAPSYRYVSTEVVLSPTASARPGQNNSLAVLAMAERNPPVAVHPDPSASDSFFSSTPVLDGAAVARFLSAHPEGKMFGPSEPPPLWTGYPCPTNVAYIYLVPILAPDSSPVALVVAYTCSEAQEFLEPECQFLQAVGGVVLSALLMRRVQEGDKVKAQFISNMSHELRTPLHGILASAELLSDTDLTPAQASNLRAIQACSSSLSSTISHVLAFAKTTGQSLQVRSDGSHRPIDSAEVELHAFVEEAVGQTFVSYQYGTRARRSTQGALDEFFDPATAAIDAGGLYDTTGPPQTMLQCLLDFRGSPVAVLVDAIALRRIIINLVSNAFKYTPSGHVKVSLSTAPAPARDGRIAVELSVLDTGKGMSEDFLRRFCFQPFAQEDPITPGTGLGLAITSNLVRSLGGSISVTSVQGRGSEFTVSLLLPAATATAQSEPLRSAPTFAGQLAVAFIGYSITDKTLQTQRRLLERMFTDWGVELRADEPESDSDLLIVDESAPVDTLLAFPNHRALWASADRQLAPTDPFVDVLLKPIGPVQLEEVISKLLSRDRLGGDRAIGASRLRVDVDPHSSAPSPIDRSPTDVGLSNGVANGAEQLSAAPEVLATGPSVSTPRVLHVEDNGVNRSVLRAFFKKKGIPLDEAVDGAKGAEMFQRAPPGHYSIVLMDLSMPILSGFGSVELIRAFEQERQAHDPAYPRVPIFALTGSSSSEVQQRALCEGFDRFISKPVSLKELWSLLQAHQYV